MNTTPELSHRAPDWVEAFRQQLLFRPLVLFTAALLAGIVLAEQGSWPLLLGAELPLVAAAAWGLRRKLAQVSLLPFTLLAGCVLHGAANFVPADDISGWSGSQATWLSGTIVEVQAMTFGRRLVLQLDGKLLPYSGRVLVYDRSSASPLSPGDIVYAQVVGLRRPRRSLNPGEFDWQRFLRRRGIGAEGRLAAVRVISHRPSLRERLQVLSQQARARALANFREFTPGPERELYADILAGMVYGRRAAGQLPSRIEDLYRRTGTIHLLVVSGAQVSFIIATLLLLLTGGLRRVGDGHLLGRRWALAPWQIIVMGLVLTGFAVLSGLGPSVCRSLVMAGLVVFAMMCGRRYDPATALALAALVLIITDPNIVFDLGAQLSFAATMGVIIFLPRSVKNEAGVIQRPSLLSTVALGSLGAWIATTPIIVHNFCGVAVTAAVANLVAVPVSLVLVPMGMLALITGAYLPTVTTALCWLGKYLVKLTLLANELCASLPGAYVDAVYLSPWGCLAWYVVVGGGLYLLLCGRRHRVIAQWLQDRSHRNWLVVGAAVATAAATTWYAAGQWRAAGVRISFLAVGEGQCVLIESGRHAIMVDAGSGEYRYPRGRRLADRVIIPLLARRGIRRLEALILTHPDADHCNAVSGLLERIKVGMIIDPLLPHSETSRTYQDAVSAARAHQVPVYCGRRGQVIRMAGGTWIELLSPRRPLLHGTDSDTNNNSIAVRVVARRLSVLLLADLQEEGLRRLLEDSRREGRSIAADIVLLPHHGRHLGDLRMLLGAVRPRWCIVSSGAPGDELAGTLRQACQDGRGMLITNETCGMITVTSGAQATVLRSFVAGQVDKWQERTDIEAAHHRYRGAQPFPSGISGQAFGAHVVVGNQHLGMWGNGLGEALKFAGR